MDQPTNFSNLWEECLRHHRLFVEQYTHPREGVNEMDLVTFAQHGDFVAQY